MKTKLLKRIRKQYSIVYYPNGVLWNGSLWHVKDYLLYKRWRPFFVTKGYSTKEGALEAMMEEVRHTYRKKVNKRYYKGSKVWWNGE